MYVYYTYIFYIIYITNIYIYIYVYIYIYIYIYIYWRNNFKAYLTSDEKKFETVEILFLYSAS